MSFLWRDHVFTGDTLLIDGCGAPTSSGRLTRSTPASPNAVRLPPDHVWPGHDYKAHQAARSGMSGRTTTAWRIAARADFIALMDAPASAQAAAHRRGSVPANLRLACSITPALTIVAPRVAAGYAGDVTPELAWRWWQSGKGVVVDIRTNAEREWVGFVPDAPAVAVETVAGDGDEPGFRCADSGAVRRTAASRC